MKNTFVKSKNHALLAGLVFCVAGIMTVQADTLITFQVDMTAQVDNATFTNGVNTVYAVGTFNNWGNSPYSGLQLTNDPTAPNTNLYTGTYDDTLDTNGAQLNYKFTTSNLGFETTYNNNDNRATLLPASDGSLVLPVQWFSDADPTPVAYACTFQVNMTEQIALGNFNPDTDTVEVQGQFNGWTTGDTLLQEGTSDIYTNNFLIAGSPGAVNEFKYVIQPAADYETPSPLNGVGGNLNRFVFVVPDQTLPVVYFSDQSVAPVVTNNVVFSVDMTAQALSGFFNSSTDTVTVRGAFQGWNTTSTVLTNNPSASNTNIYSCVVSNMVAAAGGKVTDFKFGFNPNTINNSYENNPTHTYAGPPSVYPDGSSGNRAFNMPDVNNSQVILPTVYYSDESPYSVLPAPTTVTFSVNMTNAVGTDSHVFNPAVDSVYLNGLVLTNPPGSYAFATWTNAPTGPTWTNAIANFLMINNPVGSEIYTISVPIPAGYPVQLSYLYSINGNADEPPGGGVNHTNYIRSTGAYVLSLDKFGSMVQEQAFGNLAVGPKSGANVPITWLGLPGVHLQVKTNLTSGSWVDLLNTAGQSATNYPVGAGASYFRLIQPF